MTTEREHTQNFVGWIATGALIASAVIACFTAMIALALHVL